MIRSGTMDDDFDMDSDMDMDGEGGLEEIQGIMAIQIQKIARGFLVRCTQIKYFRVRFEKIWDPRRNKHYYYDKETDLSAWKLPLLFIKHDHYLDIAPTFLPDDAARIIQTMGRRIMGLHRTQLQFKEVWEEVFDFYSGSNYYANRKTFQSVWVLPKFMRGKYDHTPKSKSQAGSDTDEAAAAAAGGGAPMGGFERP